MLRSLIKKIFGKLSQTYFYRRRRLALVFRHISIFCSIPNIWKPKTVNEIVLKKLLFDRDPKLTLFADKIKVRDFVVERLGTDKYLTKMFGTFLSVEELFKIDVTTLPQKFVLKPNHGSGWVKIIKDWAAEDKVAIAQEAHRWLGTNYGLDCNEWAYIHIQPMLMIEELLAESPPIDYRIVCFHGQPKWIYTKAFFDGVWHVNNYDLDWNLLPVSYRRPQYSGTIPRPTRLEEMLSVASTLSEGTDFLRVDLYNIEDRVVFGELTNYPNGACAEFIPAKWDRIFGEYYFNV